KLITSKIYTGTFNDRSIITLRTKYPTLSAQRAKEQDLNLLLDNLKVLNHPNILPICYIAEKAMNSFITADLPDCSINLFDLMTNKDQ
ncbi:MAG: hypothetical protein MHPSP_004338, partial [Paramarteilia canceri]